MMNPGRSAGERYAENFANQLFSRIFPKYIAIFGDPIKKTKSLHATNNMVYIPYLEIVFAIIVSVLPPDAVRFSTIMDGYSPNNPISFTRSGDVWMVKSGKNLDFGAWKLEGLTVVKTKTRSGQTEKVELKRWLDLTKDKIKADKNPVIVQKTENRITLSDSKNGFLGDVVVDYSTKKNTDPGAAVNSHPR